MRGTKPSAPSSAPPSISTQRSAGGIPHGLDIRACTKVRSIFMPTRKRLGRPPEIPDRVELMVYLSRKERAAIVRAAKRAHVSASAWVRAVALAALPDRTTKHPGDHGRHAQKTSSAHAGPAGST